MRSLSLPRSTLALLPALLSHAVHAQEVPFPGPRAIPETVVTATRTPAAPDRVPAATTVIDRRAIEERGFVTLADALATVPGLRLAQLGGPGQQASAFLRGAGSRNVLVLRDGVPANDAAEPNGAYNFGNELLGDVERIEVSRGPASSLFGSAAIGGVVNLVSRRAPEGRAFAPHGEVAGGAPRSVRATLGAGGAIGAYDYLLSGQTLSTRGFDATAPRLRGNTGERDGFRSVSTTARLGMTPAEGTRIEGLVRWRENHLGLDNVPRDDPNYSGQDRNVSGQLRGETRLLGGAWTTGLRVAAGQDRRRYENLPDALNPGASRDLYRGQRVTADWGNAVRLPDAGPFSDAALNFGATHLAEDARSAAGSAGFRTRVDAAAHTTSGFGGLQARVGRLDLSGSLRRDAASDYDGATTWRAGGVLALPEIASRLRATGGTGFTAPSLYQRYGVIGGFFQGNSDLRPERSTGWDLGIETDLPGRGRPDLATVTATYFRSRIRDLISFNAAFDSLENVDRARISGVELGLVARPARGVEASLAWTVTAARDDRTGRRLPRRPEHVVAAGARIAVLPRLVVAPEVLFTGRSPEGAFASYRDDGSSIPAPRDNRAGTVVNLTVTHRLAAWPANVFVEARNLGNSRFEPASGFITPGRSVMAGTRFGF